MADWVSGSLTITIWNRRSSALSFSKYFWYSCNVVAPMALSSPLERAGLRILAASMAPSDAPAPTSVWISSMNSMTSPSDSTTSFTTLLSLSSNSPLYLAPAIRAPMSSENSCLDFRFSGTSPLTIRCARPSAIAVLPVPGSPIRMDCFLYGGKGYAGYAGFHRPVLSLDQVSLFEPGHSGCAHTSQGHHRYPPQ